MVNKRDCRSNDVSQIRSTGSLVNAGQTATKLPSSVGTSSAPVLKVTQLTTCTIGDTRTARIVDHLDLAINREEFFAVVGESGCGKSMTCLSIGGLLPPNVRIESGTVELLGKNLVSMSSKEINNLRGREFAMVFQDPLTSLNPTMRVGTQIMEPMLVHKLLSKRRAVLRVNELLGLVGFVQPRRIADAYPHELSGGMRQRVAIAMALACGPKLLIADEPTTALDATIQAQLLHLFKSIQKQMDLSILFVTHDLRIVREFADRVMIMYAGREAESGKTSYVLGAPRHRYTSALLACSPDMTTSTGMQLEEIRGAVPDPWHMPKACRFHPRCGFADKRCAIEAPRAIGDDYQRWTCWHPNVIDKPKPSVASELVWPIKREDQSQELRIDADRLLVLSVKNIRKIYRQRSRGVFERERTSLVAVDNVSLDVVRGETFGLVGESGSGKSTLGRMIVALERPDGGRIEFQGMDVTSLNGKELRRLRRHFQMMFQDPYSSLDRRMHIKDIVAEPFIIHALGSEVECERSVRSMLERVGLPPGVGSKFPRELSGGQRQRVGLARALMLSPQLIVADEPVSALDVSVQAKILNLMKDVQNENALSYIFISHDLSVVRYMADRIGVMYHGRIVEIGGADAVYRAPLHPYTKELIDATVARTDQACEIPVRAEHAEILMEEGCRYRTRCPFALDLCASEVPRLRFVGTNRAVACHRPLIDTSRLGEAERKVCAENGLDGKLSFDG